MQVYRAINLISELTDLADPNIQAYRAINIQIITVNDGRTLTCKFTVQYKWFQNSNRRTKLFNGNVRIKHGLIFIAKDKTGHVTVT